MEVPPDIGEGNFREEVTQETDGRTGGVYGHEITTCG